MTADASRSVSLGRLMGVIHQATDGGESIPCLNVRRSHLWLSDDRADQDAAAFGCSICPVFAACESYIEAHPEPSGVWAGVPHGRKYGLSKELR